MTKKDIPNIWLLYLSGQEREYQNTWGGGILGRVFLVHAIRGWLTKTLPCKILFVDIDEKGEAMSFADKS